MADEADVANDMVERNLQQSLRMMNFKRELSDDCVDCGTVIPIERQKASGGTVRCINCAKIYEIKGNY